MLLKIDLFPDQVAPTLDQESYWFDFAPLELKHMVENADVKLASYDKRHIGQCDMNVCYQQ